MRIGGARGYVSKGATADDLIEAVRTVANGGRYLDPDIASEVALNYVNAKELSTRELDILHLLRKAGLAAIYFARTNSPSVTDTLQQQVPAAVSIDTNGNPFSQSRFYRGFQASPLQGTPQGLAVYQNGIRVNEVFGDTVNWNLIPPQAIYSADIFTNNPIFGLNALGGGDQPAMKNGFLWQGLRRRS